MTIRVFEAFSGVGSQRMALRNLGIDHEVVAISDVDEFTVKSYANIHDNDKTVSQVTDEEMQEYLEKRNIPLNDKGVRKILKGKKLKEFYEACIRSNNLGDISKVVTQDIPDHDLFTYSFPCQDISVAGKGLGLNEGSDTRSGLLWECQKVIAGKNPKYLLLENVKNLVGKKHRHNFDKWLEWLEEEGYANYWKVLNAKDYGIPQNRERVFVVSILGEHEPYQFPEPVKLELRLKDVLEDEVDEKFYLDDEKTQQLVTTVSEDHPEKTVVKMNRHEVKGENQLANTLLARDYKGFGNQDMNGVIEPKAKRLGGIFDKEGTKHQAGAVWDKDQISPALDTMQGGWRQPSVVIGASRGRNPENPSDRTVGSPTEQRLEINKQGTSNTITTVQKDNYVVEPKGRTDYIGENETYTVEVLRTLQKEIGKEAYAEWEDRGLGMLREKEILRQDVYEERLDVEENRETQECKVKSTECENEGGVLYRDQGVSEVFVDEKSRRSPHRSESYEQFARELGSFMQELSYEESSQEESLSDLWSTAEGVGSVQQALHQIQKIWRPELYEIPSFRIRKLSPLECWRLMGFSDDDFHKAEEVNSNSQLYKQAGNSIVVDVLEGIFKQLLGE